MSILLPRWLNIYVEFSPSPCRPQMLFENFESDLLIATIDATSGPSSRVPPPAVGRCDASTRFVALRAPVSLRGVCSTDCDAN